MWSNLPQRSQPDHLSILAERLLRLSRLELLKDDIIVEGPLRLRPALRAAVPLRRCPTLLGVVLEDAVGDDSLHTQSARLSTHAAPAPLGGVRRTFTVTPRSGSKKAAE